RVDDRLGGDRTSQRALVQVERGHPARRGRQLGAHASAVGRVEAGHGHVLDIDERGVPEPELVERPERQRDQRDDEETAARDGRGERRQPQRCAWEKPERRGRGPHSYNAPASTSPRNWTSASSPTPNRSRTRRRPSAMSAITSAVVASPLFSTKFACFSEKHAPPTASPRQPAASSSMPALRPSARGSSGFLKVEPKVLIPEGWAAFRLARISARVAFTCSGSAG